MELTVRPATQDDRQAVVALAAQMPWDTTFVGYARHLDLLGTDSPCCITFDGQTPVGFAIGQQRDPTALWVYWIAFRQGHAQAVPIMKATMRWMNDHAPGGVTEGYVDPACATPLMTAMFKASGASRATTPHGHEHFRGGAY